MAMLRDVVVVLGCSSVLLAVSACNDKRLGQGDKQEQVSTVDKMVPSTAGQLMKYVSERAKGRVLNEMTLRYVRPDGVMDTTYASMFAKISDPPPPEPADDPNRPVGAPVLDRNVPLFDSNCVSFRWAPGGPVSDEGMSMCGMYIAKPAVHEVLRCSTAQLWERARKDGAPEGLATISWATIVTHTEDDIYMGSGWEFVIEDRPRNISFKKSYRDDCAPQVERPPA